MQNISKYYYVVILPLLEAGVAQCRVDFKQGLEFFNSP